MIELEPSNPTDCHPDLQWERLELLANFFAGVCSKVAELHDATSGDDGWSLGCRRNARWRNLLAKKALSGDWPWFSVVRAGKRFVFSVGAVPVRFYRGRPHKPTSNTLSYDAPELSQMAIAFRGVQNQYKDLHYRFAIETGLLGEPTAVVFAGLAKENGSVVCHWTVPFADAADHAQPTAPRVDDMVRLPAPVIGPKVPNHQRTSSDDAS